MSEEPIGEAVGEDEDQGVPLVELSDPAEEVPEPWDAEEGEPE